MPDSAWNTDAKIACAFSFKCPKQWDRLQPTARDGVRHCPACDRDVHLALTEEDFRLHAEGGHCVAVRVIRPSTLKEAEPIHVLGLAYAPYRTPLKKT